MNARTSPTPGDPALVRRQFGATAAEYATSHVHAHGPSLGRLVELARPDAAWNVLDVATGAGHTALAFAPHVARVTATDITPEMLAQADRLAGERGLSNVTVGIAAAESLPFAGGAFDLVTCRIAAHHFRRVDRFASECWRVLRPGGALALADNVSPDDPDAAIEADAIERFRDPSHVHCLSIGEWHEVLERAGFTIEHQELLDMPIELDGWARRMHVGDRDREELRRRILGASEALRASWRPQETGGDVRFVLTEVLLVARRGAARREPRARRRTHAENAECGGTPSTQASRG